MATRQATGTSTAIRGTSSRRPGPIPRLSPVGSGGALFFGTVGGFYTGPIGAVLGLVIGAVVGEAIEHYFPSGPTEPTRHSDA